MAPPVSWGLGGSARVGAGAVLSPACIYSHSGLSGRVGDHPIKRGSTELVRAPMSHCAEVPAP